MVKVMSGMDFRLLQSTDDSPMGLGRRSQSCSNDTFKIIHDVLRMAQRPVLGQHAHLVNVVQYEVLGLVLFNLVLHPYNSHLTGTTHWIAVETIRFPSHIIHDAPNSRARFTYWKGGKISNTVAG
jgi:hypothetical protein